MNPTGETARKAELAWEAYYERFDTPDNREMLENLLIDNLVWDAEDGYGLRPPAREAIRQLVWGFSSQALLAMLRGFGEPIPTFAAWEKESP